MYNEFLELSKYVNYDDTTVKSLADSLKEQSADSTECMVLVL